MDRPEKHIDRYWYVSHDIRDISGLGVDGLIEKLRTAASGLDEVSVGSVFGTSGIYLTVSGKKRKPEEVWVREVAQLKKAWRVREDDLTDQLNEAHYAMERKW